MKSGEKCEDDLGNAAESGYVLNTLNSCIKVPESNLFFQKKKKKTEMEKKNPRINEHSKINDRQQVEEQGDS